MRITCAQRVMACGLAFSVLTATASVSALRAQEAEAPASDTFALEGQGVTLGQPAPGTPEFSGGDDGGVDTSRQWFFQRIEGFIGSPQAERQALLSDAEAEIKAGRPVEAQRLLERLIAEAPDAAEANVARGHLAQLYRAASREAEGDVLRGGAADLPWSRSSGAAKRPVIPVAQAVSDKFIADVGDRVFFSEGNAEIGARARAVLKAQAAFLLRRPDLGAVVEGHVDDGQLSKGDVEKLALARAEAVRERLIAEGVEPHRIATKAKGRDEPVSTCQASACEVQNRRAVTVLLNGAPVMERASMAPPRADAASSSASSPATQ